MDLPFPDNFSLVTLNRRHDLLILDPTPIGSFTATAYHYFDLITKELSDRAKIISDYVSPRASHCLSSVRSVFSSAATYTYDRLIGSWLKPFSTLLRKILYGLVALAVALIVAKLASLFVGSKSSSHVAITQTIELPGTFPSRALYAESQKGFSYKDKERVQVMQDDNFTTRIGRRSKHRTRHGQHHKHAIPYTEAPTSLSRKILRNTVFLRTSLGKQYRGLCVGDRYVIIPHHYLLDWNPDTRFTITCSGTEATCSFAQLEFVSFPQVDTAIFTLPKSFPPCPDIRSIFIREINVCTINQPITMWLSSPDGTMRELVSSSPTVVANHTWRDISNKGVTFYEDMCFSTEISTNPGDCGSLYTLQTALHDGTYALGIHVAGANGIAYGHSLSQETIDDLIQAFIYHCEDASGINIPLAQGPTQALPPAPSTNTNDFPVFYEKDGYKVANVYSRFSSGSKLTDPERDANLAHRAEAIKTRVINKVPYDSTPLGVAESRIHMNRSTSLRPTALHAPPFIEPTHHPAVLAQTHGNPDPLVVAMAKFKRPDITFENLPLLRSCAFTAIAGVFQPKNRGLLSPQSAISGDGVLQPMDRSSSAGFPYNTWAASLRQPASKGTWFGDPRHPEIHPVLAAHIEVEMDMLKKGIAPDWLNAVQLKDETVSLQAIADCKTRLYYSSPVSQCIILRMLFGDFISAVLTTRAKDPLKVSCSVGVAPTDPTFTYIYNRLNHEDFDAFAHDQKGFDRHQSWIIAQYLGEAINSWYPVKEDASIKTARITALRACYNPLLVVEQEIVTLDYLMTSGNVLTSFINSFYLEICYLAAMSEYTRSPLKPPELDSMTPRQVKKETMAFYYGDDSIVFVPKEWKITSSWFFSFFARLGLDTTHCVKDLDTSLEPDTRDITFLKRTTSPNEDGVLTARLPLETLQNMLCYVKKSNLSSVQVYNATAESLLYEARRHGIRVFKEYARAIVTAFSEQHIPIHVDLSPDSYVGIIK